MTSFIRLAPDPADPTFGLSKDEALNEARAAFQRARMAQYRLVSMLALTELLADPGSIGRLQLTEFRRKAERQVERAQAVAWALAESLEALERYRAPGTDEAAR